MSRFEYDDEYVGADVDAAGEMPLNALTASGMQQHNVVYVQESKTPRRGQSEDSE